MDPEEIMELKKQIEDLTHTTMEAVEAAKASATIAYQASLASVKSNQGIEDKLDAYIKDDTEWKIRAEPVIKAYENTNWLGGLLIKFLKFMGLLGSGAAAYLLLKNFFHH